MINGYLSFEEQRNIEARRLAGKYGRVMREREEWETPIEAKAEHDNAIEDKTTQP